MANLIQLLARILAAGILGYLLCGLATAAAFVAVINPAAGADLQFCVSLILTWPLFIAMAVIFWFAAGL